LESIIVSEAKSCNWFGSEPYEIMVTSEYDDYKNGIDSIVEFQQEKGVSYLGLAVDATFGTDVSRKFKRILREIDNGEMPEVKYFKSEYLALKGMKGKLPRVVIGVDIEKIKELMELRLDKEEKTKETEEVEAKL